MYLEGKDPSIAEIRACKASNLGQASGAGVYRKRSENKGVRNLARRGRLPSDMRHFGD